MCNSVVLFLLVNIIVKTVLMFSFKYPLMTFMSVVTDFLLFLTRDHIKLNYFKLDQFKLNQLKILIFVCITV